ncbi:MAG: hypothetical protein JWN95_3261 [Frankiales bacterium]|nr:hypothetical protein [Frankiales bacterium]
MDASLYASSAAIAAACTFSSLTPMREWGRLSFPVYAIAAGVSLALFLCWAPSLAGWPVRRLVTSLRGWLLAAVLIGVSLVPLVRELVLRTTAGPAWAQSEVLVIEQAARALAHGHTPYDVAFTGDGLSSRHGSFGHFPYLPLMAIFGLPRLLGVSPLTDARLYFFLTAAVVCGYAIRLHRRDRDGVLLVVLVLFASSGGALQSTVGGDDLPVLALLLLAVVSLGNGRPQLCAAALTVAMLLKATAWPFALVLLVVTGRAGRRRGQFQPWLAVLAGVAMAGWLSNPAGFVEDVVLFPLGLGSSSSPAGPTPVGNLVHLLVGGAPGSQLKLTSLACAGLAVGAAVLVILRLRRLAPTMSTVLAGAVALYLVLFLLTAVGRPGYFSYPLNLLCWWYVFAIREARPGIDAPSGNHLEEAADA